MTPPVSNLTFGSSHRLDDLPHHPVADDLVGVGDGAQVRARVGAEDALLAGNRPEDVAAVGQLDDDVLAAMGEAGGVVNLDALEALRLDWFPIVAGPLAGLGDGSGIAVTGEAALRVVPGVLPDRKHTLDVACGHAGLLFCAPRLGEGALQGPSRKPRVRCQRWSSSEFPGGGRSDTSGARVAPPPHHAVRSRPGAGPRWSLPSSRWHPASRARTRS